MTHQNSQSEELAALYALDLLSIEEQEKAEADLNVSPEFAAIVAEMEAAASTIAYSTPIPPMANNLKDRLWERIAEEKSEIYQLIDTPIDVLKRQASKLSWEPFEGASGFMQAIWRVDEEKREVAFFVKASKPVKFPLHSHAGGEEILILEGEVAVDGKVYTAGERIYSEMGSAHEPETPSSCLIFCVTSLDNEILNNV